MFLKSSDEAGRVAQGGRLGATQRQAAVACQSDDAFLGDVTRMGEGA